MEVYAQLCINWRSFVLADETSRCSLYIHTLSMAAYSLQIASDSIENICTVAALVGVEEVFFHQYKKNAKACHK